MFFKVVLAFLVAAAVLVPSTRALAIVDPDSMGLDEVYGYQNVAEVGDILFLAYYDIDYGSIPTETVTAAFLFRIMDSSGPTELGSTAPFSYINSGYDEGVVAVYFSAAQVELLGITAQDTNLEVILQGNPSLFGSPPSITNASIVWPSVLSTKSHIRGVVTAMALSLELNWAAYTSPDIELLQPTANGNVFSTEGEYYFSNVIPNAPLVISDLFIGRTDVPFVDNREFDYSYRDQLLQFWDNSSIGTALDNAAAVFSTPRTLFTTMALIAFNVVVIMAMIKANPAAGQIAPLTVAIILPVGAWVGLTDMVFAALIAMFALLGTVFFLYLRRG